jgi:hypothetical protein
MDREMLGRIVIQGMDVIMNVADDILEMIVQ